MNYSMTKPCDACPFLKGSGFTYGNLLRHASWEFACHKTCKLDDESEVYEPQKKSLHCAGALIFLEAQGKPHQMMRIVERLGMYDASKLEMDSPVVKSPGDCTRRKPREPQGERADG